MTQRQIEVELGDRSYPLITGRKMASSFASVCRQYGISDTVVIVTDRNVARLHLQPLMRNLLHHKFLPLTITIPAGEAQKHRFPPKELKLRGSVQCLQSPF